MSKIIQNLIVKYFTRQASLSELDELSKWIEKPSNKKEFVKYVKINHLIDLNMKTFGTDKSNELLLKFIRREKRAANIQKAQRFGQYAAVMLMFLVIGYYVKNTFIENRPHLDDYKETVPAIISNEIEVGTDKAILTLEDGSNIDLEKGKIIHTKNIKSDGKELVYNPSGSNSTEIAFNYLTIPRGGQFHIKLADKTLVWLNSESQLKYPVVFKKGETRVVELVYGEAYFEVSPSTDHMGATFRVLSQSQEVEVLGTSFNLKAYRDETNIYTTLAEGQIAISTANTRQILEPNQQSNLNLKDNVISISSANVAQAISWRKGLFSFKGRSLEQIAKVLTRWYDVDIEFSRPELRYVKFNGVLRKDEAIEEILNSILTTNSIKSFEIKNKKITIK